MAMCGICRLLWCRSCTAQASPELYSRDWLMKWPTLYWYYAHVVACSVTIADLVRCRRLRHQMRHAFRHARCAWHGRSAHRLVAASVDECVIGWYEKVVWWTKRLCEKVSLWTKPSHNCVWSPLGNEIRVGGLDKIWDNGKTTSLIHFSGTHFINLEVHTFCNCVTGPVAETQRHCYLGCRNDRFRPIEDVSVLTYGISLSVIFSMFHIFRSVCVCNPKTVKSNATRDFMCSQVVGAATVERRKQHRASRERAKQERLAAMAASKTGASAAADVR